MKCFRICLGVLALILGFTAQAQHIHVQTAYTTAAGWDIFWYDFDSGSYAATDYVPVVISAARGQIPNNQVLTNALGAAGDPVWILPEVQAPALPFLGFGTQGQGSFLGGQIRVRLATYSGPGHFAIYSFGPFGEVNLHIATRDGLAFSDALPLSYPGGHVHVNWAFTRPGLYELGLRTEGTLVDGRFTNSTVTVFKFQVQAIEPPRLELSADNGWQKLRVATEGNVPLSVDISRNLTSWATLTNLWLRESVWTWTQPNSNANCFYRASHLTP